MGYSLEYLTEDSWNGYQLEIEEGEDEWESWNEIPIMMYVEGMDTGWINSCIFDEGTGEELYGEEGMLWDELDPHISKLLGYGISHYQTTWIEEETECLHENKVIENVRYGQEMQEGECMMVNESRTGGITGQVASFKVKTGDQKPCSALTDFTIKNWKQHEWSERDKIEENGASMKHGGEKEGIG